MGNARHFHYAIALALPALLTGCVSTQMKKLVGLPIQEAAIEYGAPVNVIDMPDGRRVFQFQSSRSVTTPTQATTQGSVWGNSWQTNTTITGGQIIPVECTYTFYSRWSEAAGAWIVTDFKVPKQLVC